MKALRNKKVALMVLWLVFTIVAFLTWLAIVWHVAQPQHIVFDGAEQIRVLQDQKVSFSGSVTVSAARPYEFTMTCEQNGPKTAVKQSPPLGYETDEYFVLENWYIRGADTCGIGVDSARLHVQSDGPVTATIGLGWELLITNALASGGLGGIFWGMASIALYLQNAELDRKIASLENEMACEKFRSGATA